MLTKDQVREWKVNPVTLARNEAIQNRVDNLIDLVLTPNVENGEFMKGMIRGLKEVLEMETEEVIENDNQV